MSSTLLTYLETLLVPLERIASILGNIGEAITAIIAGFALGFAWAQIRSARSGQLEATLHELNRDQNRAALQYPQFANPKLGKIDYDDETFDGSPVEFERYRWFVILGLVLCEHALRTPHSRTWKGVIHDYFGAHRAILASERFKSNWVLYDDDLREMWRKFNGPQSR